MKILLIHRYFWPDTPPYASMLLAIAQQLVKDGHDVEVLTSQPSYKSNASNLSLEEGELLEGFKIKRIPLLRENGRSVIFKLLNMVYFPLRILLHILFNRDFNSVMCSTAPPVVTGFFSALGAKLIGARFIYHCMDIHPEIGKISGEFKNPFVYKVLLKLDQWSCGRAEKIIVLSGDMKNSLLKRNLNSPSNKVLNIEVINNFSLTDTQTTNEVRLDGSFKKNSGKFRILFAGNIGRFQMLEAFIDAMELLSDLPQIELVFLGEGAALKSLQQRAKEKLGNSIFFFPHQNINNARKLMSEADLGIVSLLPDVYRYALPSKTMTYLAVGCPLLVTVESESEIVEFISENKIGISALPGEAESIACAIRTYIEDPLPNIDISERCKNTARKYYSEESILKIWSNLYK